MQHQDTLIIASTGAKKNDKGKLRMDLIPVSAINSLADILTFGAQKYADRNWEQGFPYGRVYSALQRHLTAWWDGEDTDPESGRSHLEHALCNIAFLNEFRTTHPELDDRPRVTRLPKQETYPSEPNLIVRSTVLDHDCMVEKPNFEDPRIKFTCSCGNKFKLEGEFPDSHWVPDHA